MTPFEQIKHEDENGTWWSARELMPVLEYTEWRNFTAVITKAINACFQSGQEPPYHFVDTTKMVEVGSGAKRMVQDMHLSRYACYLIVQNADPDKPVVALGQTYFAVQTRAAELNEDQQRLDLRERMTDMNKSLSEAAYGAGVVTSRDFAIFQDHGYMGLYDGEKSSDIHARMGLKKSQKILDWMGNEELAANLFRATQTDAAVRRDPAADANLTHHRIGAEVREAIKRIGGTMPEDLPKASESIQQLKKREAKRLQSGPSLWDEEE
jgi:DNA-damage-inducible protein D